MKLHTSQEQKDAWRRRRTVMGILVDRHGCWMNKKRGAQMIAASQYRVVITKSKSGDGPATLVRADAK